MDAVLELLTAAKDELIAMGKAEEAGEVAEVIARLMASESGAEAEAMAEDYSEAKTEGV